MNHELSPVVAMTVFPEKYPLPGPQGQLATDHGDGEAAGGEGRLDMGGHVIRSFHRMGVQGIAFLDQSAKPVLQIVPGSGVGIFLNDQTGGGVLEKNSAQAFRYRRLPNTGSDFGGDLVEPLPVGGDRQLVYHVPILL